LQGERGAIGGYALSHPWQLGTPPALNTLVPALPERPNSYYLHDIAILPTYQGKGLARAVLQNLETLCGELGLDNITLLSVGGADGFWRGQGFEDISHLTSPEKLASYGKSAVYMRKRV
jgi:GNAT superfamily N-acetyltransferase